MGGKRQNQREKILDSALRIFCERGIEQSQMTEIAKASGISRRTLYTYFSDKETLAQQLFTKNLENLFGMLSDVFTEKTLSQDRLLEDFLRGYLDIRRTHPDYVYYDYIYNNYCAGKHRDPRVGDAFSDAVRRIAAGRSPEDRVAQRLLNSPQALCLHLYFCYLQKSVLMSVQAGDLFSAEQDKQDVLYLDFLMGRVRA